MIQLRTTRITVCCLLLLLFISGSGLGLGLSAQADPSEPPTNSRVRIAAPDVRDSPIVGTIIEKTADAWIVGFNHPGVRALEVPLATMTRIEVSRGLQSNRARGFAYGALGGGALGVAMGLLAGNDDCSTAEPGSVCLEVMSAGNKAAIFGLTFGLLGGVIGALADLAPTEIWEEAALPRAALGLSPSAHGGVAALLTIRFR